SMGSHFRGLESLSALLGVGIFHSPGSFLDWLAPHRRPGPRPASPGRLRFTHPVALPHAWTDDHVAERDALLVCFANGGPLELPPLGGGFSGAQVFLARGGAGPAVVVKIGARDEVGRERFGNESIGRVLGDVVPRLNGWRESARLAAMELELAQSDEPGTTPPVTFADVYESDASESGDALLEAAPEDVLERAPGRLYGWGGKDNGALLERCGFTDARGRPQVGDTVGARALAVARGNAFESARELLEDAGLPPGWLEPAAFYRDWLPGRSLMREVYPSS